MTKFSPQDNMNISGNVKEIDVEELTECPECESEHIVRDYKRGEVTCRNCGLVVDDQVIDQGPEWRAFDSEQNERRARGGAPMSVMVHDKGLSTDIGWGGRDINGNNVPTKNRAQVYRMRKWQNRTRASNSADRNLAQALNELNRLASKIGLHRQVREEAAMLYRRAVQDNLVRGRSVEGVAAAALYGACRRCEVPRTLTEITQRYARFSDELLTQWKEDKIQFMKMFTEDMRKKYDKDGDGKFIDSV